MNNQEKLFIVKAANATRRFIKLLQTSENPHRLLQQARATSWSNSYLNDTLRKIQLGGPDGKRAFALLKQHLGFEAPRPKIRSLRLSQAQPPEVRPALPGPAPGESWYSSWR